MGYSVRLLINSCFKNEWVPVYGVHWACSGQSRDTIAKITMSKTGGSCPSSGTTKTITKSKSATFSNGAYTVKLIMVNSRGASVVIYRTSELEPSMTKPQIISNHSDKLGYNVGDIIKSECVIKNIGAAGTVYLTVSLGYIDSSNMIYLTGFPTTDQLYLNYQQIYTFKEDVKVDITDYYRQQGIGWAYLQQQMYLFFLAGHKVGGDMVWDTERHIKIYLEEPDEFKDPTSLPEVLPDLDEAIEGFGGVGGLKWLYDEVKPDAKDVIDWVVDKVTPEPKEEEEPPDIMPFIYIGFAGLIGYLLIRSQ